MKKELTIKDIPEEVLNTWRDKFLKEKPISTLEEKRIALIRQRNYVQAQKLKGEINQIIDNCISNLLREYKGESVRMDSLMKEMDPKDVSEINALSTAIILCVDMLETFVMDNNEILHKYHPDYNVEMYDKIIEIGKEAKKHMSFMSENTSEEYQFCIADSGDDVTELVRNKARAMMRRYNKQKKDTKK